MVGVVGDLVEQATMYTSTRPSVIQVPVDLDSVRLATERTGINNSGDLVESALRLLTSADLSADLARERQGAMPDFDLDTWCDGRC